MVNDPARTRLVELAEQRGVALSALSGLIGRNTTYLQQFIRKGSPRRLQENDRRTLAEFFGVDESELGASEGKENSYITGGKRPKSDWVDVPRLALGASAGSGALAEEDAPAGHLRFSEGWLRELGLSRNTLVALSVAGDSMDPTLADGDEILVTNADGRLRDGIHIIRRDGTLLVKRLLFEREGRVSVISDNKAYPSDANVSLDEVEVLGRVVWKGGRI